MDREGLLLLLIGSMALLALLLAVWQLLVSRKLRSQLEQLEKKIQLQQQAHSDKANFSTSLNRAERQRPGLPGGVRQTPEKYHYVAALAEQGLDTQGIAKALNLASAEVEQLLQLARIKQQ